MAHYENAERLVISDADGTTIDAFHAIELAFMRHGMDIGEFDFFACILLRESKTAYLKHARQSFAINPARACACGDGYSDHVAAIGACMHPFVVGCCFEDSERLTGKLGEPSEVISVSPAEFAGRLQQALGLAEAAPQP